MKYVPKNTDFVDAEQWIYSSTKRVMKFMDFLKEHDLTVTFCEGMGGGVAVEVYSNNCYRFDVEPYGYLVVGADKSLKRYTEEEFQAEFDEVK